MAHDTVECEDEGLPGVGRRNVEAPPVPGAPEVGQAASASGVVVSHDVAIFGDARHLEVVLPAELAMDGPVVGDGDLFPDIVRPGGGIVNFAFTACEVPVTQSRYTNRTHVLSSFFAPNQPTSDLFPDILPYCRMIRV